MRILVVEDERKLAGVLKRSLEEHGYAADVAYDGEEALILAELQPYDLVVLDVMLPKLDGVAVCRRLRAQHCAVPVLILIARDAVDDRVAGLDSGADDYLVKPFAFREPLALPLPRATMASVVEGRQTIGTVRPPGKDMWRVVTAPVVDHGQVVGILQVARSERDLAAALDRLVTLMAMAVPVTLLIAVAGGLFLAGRALDPIDRITRAAEQIDCEDLSRRLSVTSSPDEVGRLAATFDRMLDRLDRAFQRQRQFTADAAHELRTPLAMLISQIDLALERRRTVPEYYAALASMRVDATRMSRLLGDLLTLARAESRQDPLAWEPVPLDELAGDVVAAMAPLAQKHGVRLAHVSPGGASRAAAPVVWGDQTRLPQLLVNLVGNGLKYTPAGGTVTVSVGHEGGTAMIEVADTGEGIPPEHLPHLFERFYRVDPARTRKEGARTREEGGAGLGLAIGRWIAQAHGGEIVVESERGRGSCFRVRLPLRGVPPASPPNAAVHPPATPPASSSFHVRSVRSSEDVAGTSGTR